MFCSESGSTEVYHKEKFMVLNIFDMSISPSCL